MIKQLLGGAVLVLLPSTAFGQLTATHGYLPGQALTVAWDASVPGSTIPEDALAGYEVVASTVLQTGTGTNVTVRTWAIGNVTTFAIPAAEVPARPFYLSVRARSVGNLLSGHSNSLLFRDPSAPSAPGSLRRGQ